MALDLATRATGGYPADLRNGAGIKISKVGLRADISLDLLNVQQLDGAPSGGLVPVQDPITGRIQALNLEQLPTAQPGDGSVSNVKLAAAPSLTVKGNTTEANAQLQDIPIATLAAPGNPIGDGINFTPAVYQVPAPGNGTIQAALTTNFAAGGFRSNLPAGIRGISAPLTMRRGSALRGQADLTYADTPNPSKGEPRMVGSTIVATANMDYMVGPFEFGRLQTGNRIEDLTLDGGKKAYGANPAVTVGSLIKMSPVGGRFSALSLSNGSFNGFYSATPGAFSAGADPSWVNWYAQMNLTNFAINFLLESTDSFVTDVYANGGYSSGQTNQAGIWHKSYGGIKLIGGQLENCGNGLILEGDPDGVGSYSLAIGCYFNINQFNDILVRRSSGRDAANGNSNEILRYRHTIGMCQSHFSFGQFITIENNIVGPNIVGVTSNQVTGFDVNFGTGVTGVTIYGLNSDKAPAARFNRLPADCDVISGGPGGSYNRLGRLIVSPPNVAQTVADAALNVYGYDTVLGQEGVSARFGFFRSSSSLDTALLVGNITGNTPFIKVSDGEVAQLGGFQFLVPGGIAWSLDRPGSLRPGADAARNLGAPTLRWNNSYFAQNPTVGSDQKLKSPPKAISEAMRRAARAIPIEMFQYLASIAAKGADQARWNIGVIAQKVVQAFADEGLDAFAYGFVGSDPEIRQVPAKRMTEKPRFVAETVVMSEIVVEDGKAIRREVSKDEMVPVMEIIPIVDEAGNPVMESVEQTDEDGRVVYQTDAEGRTVYRLDEDGNRILKSGNPIAVPEMVTRQAVYTRQAIDFVEVEYIKDVPTGGVILSVRYEQLLALKASDLEARLAKLEAI